MCELHFLEFTTMPTTSSTLTVLVTSLDVGLHCVTDTVTVD